MGISTILRFQLRLRLRNLISDDKVILSEGIDRLNYQELQNACKARGMRAVGMSEDRLKRQLSQWLTLSLHEKVPATLLLLTRAMYLPDNIPASQQLQATLQALPNATVILKVFSNCNKTLVIIFDSFKLNYLFFCRPFKRRLLLANEKVKLTTRQESSLSKRKTGKLGKRGRRLGFRQN